MLSMDRLPTRLVSLFIDQMMLPPKHNTKQGEMTASGTGKNG